MRFRVQSEADARRYYLVELDANRNAGECDCPQWKIRIGPLIENDYQRKLRRRCKHIIAAREYFLDQWLDLLAKQRRAMAAKREMETA